VLGSIPNELSWANRVSLAISNQLPWASLACLGKLACTSWLFYINSHAKVGEQKEE